MPKIFIAVVALAGALAASPFAMSAKSAEPQVTRNVLLNVPTQLPDQQLMLVQVTIPVGGREGRHTHPGTLVVYVQEGAISLYHEGKDETIYRAGDSFFVDAGKIHEGINRGDVPAKALATFIVQKGVLLTTQVE